MSCQTNSIKSDHKSVDTAKQPLWADTLATTSDTLKSKGTFLFVWSVDFDNKTKMRNLKLKQEYLNIDSLIKGLNETYPNIKLDKIKISGDTLFTEIKDSEYLGERIGTDGAFAYIADAVINLTSVKDIDFVKIDFDDGSHISPGTWSKKEYSNYKEVH